MSMFNIGLSAIRANQVALQTISNNIANANTEGYRRQRVLLAEEKPNTVGNLQFGNGVVVVGIERVRDLAVDTSLMLNQSQTAAAQTGLEALQQVEQLYATGSGSLQSELARFFDQVEQLSISPAEDILRRGVLAAAESVATRITSFHSNLKNLSQQLQGKIEAAVSRVNSLTSQIGELNGQIRAVTATGAQPTTLINSRDLLVQELGQYIDLNAASLIKGGNPLVAADGWMVVGETAPQLSARMSVDGKVELMLSGGQGPVVPLSGELGSLLTAHNQWLPESSTAFQDWSRVLLSGINSIVGTGVGLNGPVTSVAGSYRVSNPAAPLAEAGLAFPMTDGQLWVTATETLTGARTTYRVDIDVSQDSLQDVIARINALPHVEASIQPDSGKVRIGGEFGYAIDFTGRPDTVTDASQITGTARPTVTGTFQGNGNQQLVVSASGNGEIGVTPGLKLLVTDAATGDLLAELNVGSGYQANQQLLLADGLNVSLGPGTLSLGDQFEVNAVGEPDSAGFLNALGVGTLFETQDLVTVSVSQSLLDRPDQLAASRSGDPADAALLLKITAFRDKRVFGGGSDTVEERLATLASGVGLALNSKQSELDHLNTQGEQLANLQDSISGVDPNEELLLMLQYQRSFQATTKFMTTINDTLNDLLGLVR